MRNGRWFGCVGARLWPLLALAACSAPESTRSEALGGAPAAAAPRTDRACAACHAAIAAEWARSEHHASDDATFRSSLALERAPEFCQECHAPGASSEPARAGEETAGVSCSSCHAAIRLGPLGHLHTPQASAAAASGSCAACHEFDFPGPRHRAEKLQLTVSEHAASSYAGTPCVTCHMPRSDAEGHAHASHAFAEARSEGALRAALSVKSERVSPTRVRFTLRSQRVGHAFPTGDLFRRLVLEADALGADYAVLAHGQRELSRHFADLPIARWRTERVAVADDRVQADVPSVTELELGPAARDRPITWRVRYERVLHLNPAREADAVVASSLLLATGTLSENP